MKLNSTEKLIEYSEHEYGVKVPIDQLDVDMDVQRALVPFRVNKLAKNWDPSLVGELLVFADTESGLYLIGDGHHRKVVAQDKGATEMDCEVFTGVSKPDQARIFLGRNDRGVIGKTDRDRNLNTLKDPDTLMINAACQQAGLVFIGNAKEDVTFGERTAAVAIMNDAERRGKGLNGAKHLADVLTFYTEVFSTSIARSERVEPMVLQAISKLLLKKPDLDREWLAQQLINVPPQQIVASSVLFRKQQQATGKSLGAVRACAQLIAGWYNRYSHKQPGRRIPPAV